MPITKAVVSDTTAYETATSDTAGSSPAVSDKRPYRGVNVKVVDLPRGHAENRPSGAWPPNEAVNTAIGIRET
ncbi:hypothetical protein MYIN104542_01480 [Mycobacterium intermedium]